VRSTVFDSYTYSVLIVSSSEKFNSSIKPLLPVSDYYPIDTVNNEGAARRIILERTYDLVVINSPLPDDFGISLAADACRDGGGAVLLFVKSELYSEITDKVNKYGVFVLSKPTSPQAVSQAFDWMKAMRNRLSGLEKKAVSLEDKMKEIRLINRAKWILIEQLKMTESDAHRYIEKQAMDRCVTRTEIAETIIRTYN